MLLATLAVMALPHPQAAKLVDPKTEFVRSHGGGRMICRLVSRRKDPTEILIAFSRDGKASVLKGDSYLGFGEVKDASITVEALPAKGDTTATAVQFRAGTATLNFHIYKKGRQLSFWHLTVLHDPDENSDISFERASGFCVGIVPSAPISMNIKRRNAA